MVYLETNRLILREWRPEDLRPYSDINQDVRVMKYFPKILTSSETVDMVNNFVSHFKRYRFGVFVCEEKSSSKMIGSVGLQVINFPIPNFNTIFRPYVEIGWRLDYNFWGKGLATEAANEVLAKGFNIYGLNEVISITTPKNLGSRRVMEKIGLVHEKEVYFQHPWLPKDSSLSWHVLYRISKDQYQELS